jgi:type I restriction enzyme M protein
MHNIGPERVFFQNFRRFDFFGAALILGGGSNRDHRTPLLTSAPVAVQYIPPGKLFCIIREKLIKETPEEHVRQRVVRSLMEEYGYAKSDIQLEFDVRMGRKKYPIDIAIFEPGQYHFIENVALIVETKKPEVKAIDKDQGIEQLKSYMAASLNCSFGMWTNGTDKLHFQKVQVGDKFENQDVIDIPSFGKSLAEYEKPKFSELRPATELRSVFRRAHDHIFGMQGLQKDKAFHELLKVIFCKVLDEKESSEVKFYVTNKEIKSTLGQISVKKRIDDLFTDVKTRHPHIFEQEDKIELMPSVLAYIVGQMQRLSLLSTDTDAKGEAYEEIVGSNLRGDRGEFFTPRNVCTMAIRCLFSTFPKDSWNNLKVIDPSCGTGGFLVATINFIKQHFYEVEFAKWGDEIEAVSNAEKRIKDYCARNLYGIDINPLLVRASQMNEVMHGNGSGNLFCTNSLLSPGEWPEQMRGKVKLGYFDLLLANPPFGSKIPIDDKHILAQYELGHIWEEKDKGFVMSERLRNSAAPEQLFVERTLKLLKPGGRLAIVLPDSILSNPGTKVIRQWILRNAWVIGSIDLPRETFQPKVGTKTSLLMLQRKTPEEVELSDAGASQMAYRVFMGLAENIGHNKRGVAIYKRSSDGEILLNEIERRFVRSNNGQKVVEKVRSYEPVIDDDLSPITEDFIRVYHPA